MQKKCSKCQKIKDYSYFSFNKELPDQKNNICKECAKANLSAYHSRIKAINLQRRANNTLNQPNLKKECRICKKILALTEKNFYFDRFKSDGFTNICIPCTKQRQKQPDRIYNFIKTQAKQKNCLFTITREQHLKLASQNCYYCNEPSDGWLDRKDPTQGYTLDNSVSSCRQCNRMKYSLHYNIFIKFCQKIAKNHPPQH